MVGVEVGGKGRGSSVVGVGVGGGRKGGGGAASSQEEATL